VAREDNDVSFVNRLSLDVFAVNFCNPPRLMLVLALMLHDLAKFGSAALLVAIFTLILLVLLILGLAAIPGQVRKRKR
jgi:hypothetical protein